MEKNHALRSVQAVVKAKVMGTTKFRSPWLLNPLTDFDDARQRGGSDLSHVSVSRATFSSYFTCTLEIAARPHPLPTSAGNARFQSTAVL